MYINKLTVGSFAPQERWTRPALDFGRRFFSQDHTPFVFPKGHFIQFVVFFPLFLNFKNFQNKNKNILSSYLKIN
jgi:hypothetical protein